MNSVDYAVSVVVKVVVAAAAVVVRRMRWPKHWVNIVESVQHSLGIGLCKSCYEVERKCNIRMYTNAYDCNDKHKVVTL